MPFENLTVLPFEKSYIGGGANDIRAWQARSLGPGGLPDSLAATLEQIGDIFMEGNMEYRFDLTSIFKGAFFVDAGNIWLINKDPNRPNGDFDFERFVSEIAIGSGLGLRLDFSFFIIRFDVGVSIKDPAFPLGQRWVWQKKPGKYTPNVNLNLGIGYPF